MLKHRCERFKSFEGAEQAQSDGQTLVTVPGHVGLSLGGRSPFET